MMPCGNGGYLTEAMQVKYGESIEAVMSNEAWYRENTPHFKSSLEDDIENMPADQDVIEDHRVFVMINGVARIPAMGKTNSNNKDRHGDSAIAHLLADFASNHPSAPIEFISLPSREEMEENLDDYDWYKETGCF